MTIVMSIPQVCELMGCGRSRVFELLSDGTLERAPRYGRHLRIYTDSVHRALERATPRGRKHRVPGPERVRLEDIPLFPNG